MNRPEIGVCYAVRFRLDMRSTAYLRGPGMVAAAARGNASAIRFTVQNVEPFRVLEDAVAAAVALDGLVEAYSCMPNLEPVRVPAC